MMFNKVFKYQNVLVFIIAELLIDIYLIISCRELLINCYLLCNSLMSLWPKPFCLVQPTHIIYSSVRLLLVNQGTQSGEDELITLPLDLVYVPAALPVIDSINNIVLRCELKTNNTWLHCSCMPVGMYDSLWLCNW